MQEINLTVDLDDEEVEIVAIVTMTYPGHPGRLSGPPEHCFPPEPPEFEIDYPKLPECVKGRIALDDLDELVLEIAFDMDWS